LIALAILGWIALGLLALLVLVLLLTLPSLRLHFSARDGEVKLSAHYLFLRYKILPWLEKPEKKKKAKKKTKKAKEPPEEEEKPDKAKETSLSQKWEQYRPLIRKSGKVVRRLCKRVVIYKVHARVKICGEDAHQTALSYAKMASGATVLSQILGWVFTLKKSDIEILPDFIGQSSSYDISFRLRLRPVHMLTAGITMLSAYLKTSRRGKKIRKGGKKYEPATASHK